MKHRRIFDITFWIAMLATSTACIGAPVATSKREKTEYCEAMMGVGYKSRMIEDLCGINEGVSAVVQTDFVNLGCRKLVFGENAVAAAMRVKDDYPVSD